MTEELLQNSFFLTIRLVELFRYLKDEGKEFPLSERLLLSGNGVGVNLRIAKMSVAKERSARLGQALACVVECEYLLKLMAKTGYMTEHQSMPLREYCNSLISMINCAMNKKDT